MNIRMNKIVMAGALIAAAAVVSAQAADRSVSITASSQGAPADQAITDAVVSKLSNDSHLEGKIGVETKDGEVTLEGLVTTSGQAEHAERDAESVQGVTAVHNYVNSWVGQT